MALLDTSSPNVKSSESSYGILTQGDSSVSCAMVGNFEWGPCYTPVKIIDEDELKKIFGLPNSVTYEHWFSAYSYLAYSNSLYIVRAIDTDNAKNAGLMLLDVGEVVGDPTAYTYVTVYNDDAEPPTIAFDDPMKLAIYAKYPGVYGNRLSIAAAEPLTFSTALIKTGVTFASQFEYAPVGDQFAICVLLDGVIVEKFICSIDVAGVDDSGNFNYVESVLNNRSAYISAVDDTTNAQNIHSFEETLLAGGAGSSPDNTDIIAAYNEYEDKNNIKLNIIIDGANTSETVQQHIIDNIVETRKDVVAYLGPKKADVVNIPAVTTVISNLTTYISTTLSRSSSYTGFFGNYKLMYDHINGVDRWVPITGDMAGIYARVAEEKEPWFSGFGHMYGVLKNVKRLAINPKKSHRDTLYASRINPIFNDSESGPMLFGNKTLLSTNTPFNRLDVRFLFIYIKKAVEIAAKPWIGEKNTAYRRRQYVNSIKPFLLDIQGREGLDSDNGDGFYIQCDELNNTGQIKDQGGFVANHLLKPTRSIEFIGLNFVSVGSDTSFDEVL